MAPDSDKLRQRKPLSEENDDPSTKERICTLKTLKGNEVVIDGVIYDIHSFDHPGGDSINIFGGNDATAVYRMIHPYHTSNRMEKMKRVGTIPDYKCE
jgi:fatty acid desaturase (delta-4 desaturase)